MKLKKLPYDLTVCKVAAITDINTKSDFFFIGRTDDEVSLVCRAEETPQNTVDRDDGWRGFRIEGTLDFSLIGRYQRCLPKAVSVSLPCPLTTRILFS